MPWLPIITTFIGVFGAGFAVFAFIKNWKPRRLHYETVVDQGILQSSPYFNESQIAVMVNEHRMREPRNVVVRVINTGKIFLEEKDFEEAITISATNGATIVAADVRREGRTETVQLEPEQATGLLIVAPKKLLNSGDAIEFRLIVDGPEASIEVSARVAGASLLPLVTARRKRRSVWLDRAPAIVTVVLVGLMVIGLGTLIYGVQIAGHVTVPQVNGLDMLDGYGKVRMVGLQIEDIARVQSVKPRNEIVASIPAAGDFIPVGQKVTLLVSDGS